MKTRVLVTGANSQLAKTIEEIYAQNKDAIDFVFKSKQDLDITDASALETILFNNSFKYCINCAAYTNVEKAEEEIEKAFHVNAEAIRLLAIACSKNKTTLIHVSTDYVFDGKTEIPYLETSKTNPINEYGKSKLLGEQYIEENIDEHFIIRTSWLYSKYGRNFLKTIISKIKKNEALSIITSQTGTPTSCKDLTDFIYELIRTKTTNYGLYHLSTKGETTWYGFAKEIASYFPNYNSSKIKADNNYKTKAARPNYSVLNNEKALQIISSQKTWQESLKETIKSFSN